MAKRVVGGRKKEGKREEEGEKERNREEMERGRERGRERRTRRPSVWTESEGCVSNLGEGGRLGCGAFFNVDGQEKLLTDGPFGKRQWMLCRTLDDGWGSGLTEKGRLGKSRRGSVARKVRVVFWWSVSVSVSLSLSLSLNLNLILGRMG